MASVLDLVKHYQHAIEKYPNDEQKILKCIDKLFNLGVTVQHLQETGVGRTVNALRKEPGEVGQAARSLVYKWKLMVAAEESDQEGDHDTSNYNGNGRDNDDSQTRTKYEQSTPQNNQKNHEHTNGNHSGTKRNYHSSEEDEPYRKKSKHTNFSDSDSHKRSYAQVKSENSENETEDQDTDNSETEESESEMSESSVEETKANRKIKTEPVDKDRSSKHSSHDNHEVYKKESSSSKKSEESSKNSSHHSSQSKYSSDKHASREKTHSSSDKSSTKSKSHSSHEKSIDKEKNTEKKHKSSEKEKSHKDESSSSGKNQSSSQKHKSSSQKADSGSEKHKNHSEKHKSDKHNSHSSKEEKEKHKSSSENEISTEKSRSKSSSSSSKEKQSSSKDKDKESKNKSKESSSKDSHKSDKKHSSSSDGKSKSSDKKSEKSDHSSEKKNKHKSDTSSSHKSSKSSSSKSKSKANEETPKKKTIPADGEDSDDGIDCGSGASFAEALGMVSPAKPKKKPTALKTTVSPHNNFNDLSPAAMLAPTAKLGPLPAIEISALPEISPNYKPRPPPKLLPHFSEEDAISAGISSKNQRTKVYSGNKVLSKLPTLFEICVQVLQEHIDDLEYTGGVPYEILKPVVDKATPQQLFMLEHYNSYLMEDTDHLWQAFCNKHFRNKHRQELESWREMYMRCQEEQEHKLKSLTENIKIAQEAKRAPIKQTKMAYVDSVVKPPRNIARKQALHGTAHSASASPAARVASLAAAPNVLKGSVRPSPSAPVSSSSFNKPKKAPLMQKALQFMRGRKR